MKQNPLVVGSSLGAIASGVVATATTFCCVGPAVIAVLGTSGVLAAARLAPYRLRCCFLLSTIYLKVPRSCSCAGPRSSKSGIK
jgi:hypothetical protein